MRFLEDYMPSVHTILKNQDDYEKPGWLPRQECYISPEVEIWDWQIAKLTQIIWKYRPIWYATDDLVSTVSYLPKNSIISNQQRNVYPQNLRIKACDTTRATSSMRSDCRNALLQLPKREHIHEMVGSYLVVCSRCISAEVALRTVDRKIVK